jgi:nucleotide-binding universal stress UspA family protein
MNTSSQTIPEQIRKSDLKMEPIPATKRPGQIYRRILFGTDFSAASIPAFEQALKLARQNGAELLIAHSNTVPACISFMPPESYGEWEIQCRKETEKQIGALMQEARHEKVKAHMLLLSGLADNAIVDAAKHLAVDLIVIGTHGRRGVSRFFMGNVAARVVARARCDVLTVRQNGRTRESARRR